MRTSWALLLICLWSATGCGSAGIACGDKRCGGGQVCCIDCDGKGTCGPPGTGCPGAACLQASADGGVDGGVTCGQTLCARTYVCCLDCNGEGSCGVPGISCPGRTCGACGGNGEPCCADGLCKPDSARCCTGPAYPAGGICRSVCDK